MALNSLTELVSLTGNAVKSLNKSGSIDSSDKRIFMANGSPFESPRSFHSLSDNGVLSDKGCISHETDSGLEKTQTQSNRSNKNGAQGQTDDNKLDGEATIHETEEEATVIEIIQLDPSTNMEELADNYSTGTQNLNINGAQKISVPKKQLREIVSPRDGSSDLHEPQNRQESQRPKVFPGERRNKASHEKFFAVRHDPLKDELTEKNDSKHCTEDELESQDDGSSLTDQPEIIDIHEQILAVTSGVSGSSDEELNQIMIDKVMNANNPAVDNFFGKSFGKNINAQGLTLKQGALKKGVVDPTKTQFFDDVYISQFGLTEKQKGLKEALAKRSGNVGPKKKVVQPQIIRSKIQSESETDKESLKSHPDTATMISTAADPAITAAVAASAAVAATQPFLKAQQELESRMQQLLSQLGEIQGRKEDNERKGSENRVAGLECQVAELNERRLEHLETLQQQQLQIQAQLLFMTRSKSPSRRYPQSKQRTPPRQNSRIPQAVTKQTVPTTYRAPNNQSFHQQMFHQIPQSQSMYNVTAQSQPMFNPTTQSQSMFNPTTLSKHHNYLNEVRELQGSHLDTPAPRDKVPKPTPYTLPQEPQKSLGFLEELLAGKNTPDRDLTFSVMGGHSPPTRLDRDQNNSARGRRSDKSPVDKARSLVTSLSKLDQETADSVWGSRERLNKGDMTDDSDLGPAPLERYLKYPETHGSPYPKLGQRSKEKKSHHYNPDNFLEAKNVLRHLEVTRETLEKNLDQVVRSRRDMHVFSTLLGSDPQGASDEQLRIQKMVNKKISALQGDVQREVLRGLAQAEADKQAAEVELKQKLAGKKTTTSKFEYARKGIDRSKTGSLKQQAEYSARLAYGKTITSTTTTSSRGKENKVSKVKPPPKVSAIKDQKTMVRTYGKPDYQRGRTTIRDPYLHFQNTKRGMPGRTGTLDDTTVSGDGRSRSPGGRHGHGEVMNPTPRQFYFSPTRGYIPLMAGDTGPIQGQLMSMAVPLREPRLEPGVRRSSPVGSKSPSSKRLTSTPVPVTAARNVAMISFPVEDEKAREREPELAKQVLPPIDIDSISPSSSRRSDIHIGSPQQGNANVTFMYNDTHQDDDLDLDQTLTQDESDEEQSGVGIKLPGYEPKTAEYRGPSFPPQTNKPGPDWMAGKEQARPSQIMSDVIAEDLRRRDVLENNAVYWLEQELMARVISQVMPLQVPEQTTDISKAVSEKSETSEQDDSLMVADMIGQGGMQLFIDAGQPVDNALVQALVKEVIQERVSTMLAQRSTEDEGQNGQFKVRDEVDQAMEDREKQFSRGPPRVPTPEPTPKSSPVPSPRRVRQQAPAPTTPPLSPPTRGYNFKLAETEPEPEPVPKPEPVKQQMEEPQPEPQPVVTTVESESETSVSIDISEELRRVGGQGKLADRDEQVISRHDVPTPPISPSLVNEDKLLMPPARQITPPASPPPAPTPVPSTVPSRPRTPSPNRMEQVLADMAKEEVEEEEENEEEEEELDQPKPIMMSVAVGESLPLRSSRSPSPQRQPRTMSTMSETSPPSTDSSITETVNENVSEGQWLLSRSEGQVVGPPINEAIRQHILTKGYGNVLDGSTASTLRDTDDLDLDQTDDPKSEGEFWHRGAPAPDQNPMLEWLAEMQTKPFGVGQHDIPGSHVRQILSGPAPRDVMSNTGRSLGEISAGQVPPSRMAMMQQARNGQLRKKGRRSPTRSPSPGMERMSEDYSYEEERRVRKRERRHGGGRQHHSRSPSPMEEQTLPEYHRTRAPSPQQHRSRTPPQEERRIPSPTRQQRGGRSRRQMQYQPVLSESVPMATRGRSPGHGTGRRRSDNRLSHSSDQGTWRTGSSNYTQSVTRSADSVSLRRSGENGLTSSFKSKQSGVKKSVEFDLTGTYDRVERSSVRMSRDSSSKGYSPNQSAAMTYSFQESMDDSELKRIVGSTGSGSGPYRMSVTIPSIADGEESELSEIDITDNA